MKLTLISFLVFVLSVVIIATQAAPLQQVNTPYSCTYQDPSGRYYDLSPIWRSPQVDDYSIFATWQYFINVCGQTNHPCDPAGGVCQDGTFWGAIGCGDASAAVWAPYGNGTDGVSIQYFNGSSASCPPRASTLFIACDQTVTSTDAVIDSVIEYPTCSYNFKMRSRYACGSTSPPSPPSPPPPSSSSGSASTVVYETGGLSFCTQCGAPGQYACSNGVGNWVNNISVTDPVPSGSVVSRIDITLLGSYACNWNPVIIDVSLNNVPINILQSSGTNACACNSCDGAIVYTAIFAPFNLPNYVYGGKNNIVITNIGGELCLNSVNITISWDPPQFPGTSAELVRYNIAAKSTYRVCNTVGYDDSASISFSFNDPLPAGALLIMVNTQIFGSFWCYTTSNISPVITTSLSGTQIGSIKLPSATKAAYCSNTYQCSGGVWTPSSRLYQSGWPGYRYGASNTLSLSTSYYPRIGQVAVYLTYIMNGSKIQTIRVNSGDV